MKRGQGNQNLVHYRQEISRECHLLSIESFLRRHFEVEWPRFESIHLVHISPRLERLSKRILKEKIFQSRGLFENENQTIGILSREYA